MLKSLVVNRFAENGRGNGPSAFCWLWCVLVFSVLLAGCSRTAKRLKAPKINPASAAASAMESYDSDANGDLSAAELARCPGILAALATYDSDGNGAVSALEIEERLNGLTRFKTALTPLRITIRWKGRPLVGATVKLVPEAYLGEQVKPATGVTGAAGATSLTIAEEDLPAAQRGFSGVHYGTYRVEVTHPEKSIPAKYNTQTTLGYETQLGNPLAEFNLK